MFASFDETGRMTQAYNYLPEDIEDIVFYEIPSGFQDYNSIKLVKGKVEELTGAELEKVQQEYATITLARTTERKIDQLKSEMKELTSPELWDTYSDDKKKSISEYRHELDNITKQIDYPNGVVFPVLSI